MARVAAGFVAMCMVLISASCGAVLYLTFGLPPTAALICSIVALTGLALCTIAAWSWRGRNATSDQGADLSRGISDLARQVAELGRRVAGMEDKVNDAVDRADMATEPLTSEIGEIGVLIKQLAESVSAHDAMLQNRSIMTNGAAAGAAAPARSPSGSGAIAPPPAQSNGVAADRRPGAPRRRDEAAEPEAAED